MGKRRRVFDVSLDQANRIDRVMRGDRIEFRSAMLYRAGGPGQVSRVAFSCDEEGFRRVAAVMVDWALWADTSAEARGWQALAGELVLGGGVAADFPEVAEEMVEAATWQAWANEFGDEE